jgi:hypothetical protein
VREHDGVSQTRLDNAALLPTAPEQSRNTERLYRLANQTGRLTLHAYGLKSGTARRLPVTGWTGVADKTDKARRLGKER